MELDRTNQRLLNIIQTGFPLTERPYREIGEVLGILEEEVLQRLEELISENFVRFIGAIINTTSLGFESALVAFKIASEKISHAAEFVNSHPGVSHNYERNDAYNLWFTIAVPEDIDLKSTVTKLYKLSGASELLILPALKMYKIGVVLDASIEMDEIPSAPGPGNEGSVTRTSQKEYPLSRDDKEKIPPLQKKVLAQLQNSIPLRQEPFNDMARNTGRTPQEFLQVVNELMEKGVIRRFGAVPNHKKIGYAYNVMVVWEVPEDKIDEYGRRIASYKTVTHCYRRPVCPGWPFSLYSMLHCRSDEECDTIVKDIQKLTGCENYRLLTSVREFKKKRLKYFSDDFYRWEKESGCLL